MALRQGPGPAARSRPPHHQILDDQEPTTRPVLDDLAARGWATWTADDPAAATPAGTAAHAELLAAVSAHRRRVTDGIAAEEYRATLAALQRMAANLGWADAPGR